jgi:hypothetical protein
MADGVDVEQVVERVVATVVAPRVTPSQDGPVVERSAPVEPVLADVS